MTPLEFARKWKRRECARFLTRAVTRAPVPPLPKRKRRYGFRGIG